MYSISIFAFASTPTELFHACECVWLGRWACLPSSCIIYFVSERAQTKRNRRGTTILAAIQDNWIFTHEIVYKYTYAIYAQSQLANWIH